MAPRFDTKMNVSIVARRPLVELNKGQTTVNKKPHRYACGSLIQNEIRLFTVCDVPTILELGRFLFVACRSCVTQWCALAAANN